MIHIKRNLTMTDHHDEENPRQPTTTTADYVVLQQDEDQGCPTTATTRRRQQEIINRLAGLIYVVSVLSLGFAALILAYMHSVDMFFSKDQDDDTNPFIAVAQAMSMFLPGLVYLWIVFLVAFRGRRCMERCV